MGYLFSKIDPFYNTRYRKLLEQPSFNTVTYACNSFMYQGAKGRNILSSDFKAVSVDDFKVMIRTWNGKQSNCSYCHTLFEKDY